MRNALYGMDGAVGLFDGKVRINYAKHGTPQFVIVWEGGSLNGRIVRPDNTKSGSLQEAIVPLWKIEEWESTRDPKDEELESYFVETSDFMGIFPDDLPDDETYIEGAAYHAVVNRYERDLNARRRCIEEWGTKCVVCDFDFESVYGKRGVGFIHIHHLVPLSELGQEYVVNPVTEMRPVCPNCHTMLHRTNPATSIDALRDEMNAPYTH